MRILLAREAECVKERERERERGREGEREREREWECVLESGGEKNVANCK